ncbi:unnamed protein product [Darwinula stevensoni]|uniref:Small subunit processome component 20 homolog n=1 Tax=Darwinula stevensoni TaxID=69355 RepID=A0A7R9ADT5_9CRUS|nr:unnamed protein product [Darwinula stevensoni]CAG0901637.1 unnamed protein product [Darwinula stevensoni]
MCITHEKPLNSGSCLLLSHVKEILLALKPRIREGHRKALSSRDLVILTRISEMVSDPVESADVLHLLIPVLNNRLQQLSMDTQINVLLTAQNLICIAQAPISFVRSLSRLFSLLNGQQVRWQLCAVFGALGEREPGIKYLSDLAHNLNSWHPKRVEELDYDRRLQAFKDIRHVLQEDVGQATTDFLCLVIYNASYSIRKSKDENVRHEFIAILSALVMHCGGLNHKLKELAILTSEDPDTDFFANIGHLQLHRRVRALHRLSREMEGEQKGLSGETLTHFLLPLVSAFLFNPKYTKENHVIDAAIQCLGRVASHLPWFNYHSLLRYHLGLLPRHLEHQKTAIKVVVSILDAFHFDLSASMFHPIAQKVDDDAEVDNEQDENEKEEEGEKSLIAEEGSENSDEREIEGKAMVLDARMATRVHETIIKSLLPHLIRLLRQRSKSDLAHKVNRSHHPEDEEILRIPIALPIVKLLQNLPKGTLEAYLPSILLKFCEFLKSRSEGIREASRDTLTKLMTSLGPRFLPYLVGELKGCLKRGYQLHVMIYSVHSVLKALDPLLQVGELDPCLLDIYWLCHEELFGAVSEEKDVKGITGKVKEARGNKGFDTLEILARFTSQGLILPLITPLKEVLSSSRSHKVVQTVVRCLEHISRGLVGNSGLSMDSLLLLVLGLVGECIPDLQPRSREPTAPRPDPRLQPADTFIVPPEPGRAGPPVKAAMKTNAHVLVQFGFHLLYSLLKQEDLDTKDGKTMEALDPFLAMTTACLESPHVKVISTALRCLLWLLRLKLPSSQRELGPLSKAVFSLLHKHAAPGMAGGDNAQMVLLAFKVAAALCFNHIIMDADMQVINLNEFLLKVITQMVREQEDLKLSAEQLRILVTYAEADLYDASRQGSAFGLLRAIITRKMVLPELHETMKKVAELSITSELPHIQGQARQVMFHYILTYSLKKELEKYIEFYLGQLGYQLDTGRASALEMIHTIISEFPLRMVREHASIFFISLAPLLVNEESVKCRKMAALTLKSMLSRLPITERKELFQLCLLWLQDKKVGTKQVGSQLAGLILEVGLEGSLTSCLEDLFPILVSLLKSSVDGETCNERDADFSTSQKSRDHLLFHVLSLLVKIPSQVPNLLAHSKWSPYLNSIWALLDYFLLHPFSWVRLTASQLLGLLFAFSSPGAIAKCIASEGKTGRKSQAEQDQAYLQAEPSERFLKFLFATCSQFQGELIEEQLALQVMKNLVYLGKVLLRLPLVSMTHPKLTFPWLLKKLSQEASREAALDPKNPSKRRELFKWIGAVLLEMEGGEKMAELLPLLLVPLARELTDVHALRELKDLAEEVVDLIRSRTKGQGDLFPSAFAQAQSQFAKRRALRRIRKAQELVQNPEKAARQKIKKQVGKRAARKRKMENAKPHRKAKQRRLKELAIPTAL